MPTDLRTDTRLTDEQLKAVDLIRDSKVSILSGGPGTGKTTTLSYWLRGDNELTYCFAPTGKAAQRMMEAFMECGLSLPAKTVHSGLIPERTGYDGRGWQFYYNENRPLPCKRVVVDEMSMMDNATFSWLLKAISDDCQLILVGDPDQLPPVGKGCPFLDMIKCGKVPHAKLNQVHRFAGRIAHVCKAINQGQRFETSREVNLDQDAGEYGPENFRHIERPSPTLALQSLDVVAEKIRGRGFDPLKDLQVIVTRNDSGGVNREIVNERLQKLLNPRGQSLNDCPYRVGDRVMCLQNGLRETYSMDIGYPTKNEGCQYIANGESGSVVVIEPKAVYCKFGGALFCFSKSAWKSQICLSYAITAHKSQGGGWPVVVYLIDDTRMSDRSLVYTAVSRSRKLCFSIGRMATLQEQVSKVSVIERKTFLSEMLNASI